MRAKAEATSLTGGFLLGWRWTAEGWVGVGIMVTFIFTRSFIRWIRTHPATARCKHAENKAERGGEELLLGVSWWTAGWLDPSHSGSGPNHSPEPAVRLMSTRVSGDTVQEPVRVWSKCCFWPGGAEHAFKQSSNLASLVLFGLRTIKWLKTTDMLVSTFPRQSGSIPAGTGPNQTFLKLNLHQTEVTVFRKSSVSEHLRTQREHLKPGRTQICP